MFHMQGTESSVKTGDTADHSSVKIRRGDKSDKKDEEGLTDEEGDVEWAGEPNDPIYCVS